MKKTSLIFALCFLLCTFDHVLAYTSEDIERANTLAKDNVIVNHSDNPEKYRLDDTISRQELISIALKLRWVATPLTYTCKGYFTDAIFWAEHTDAWVCRTVELAADREIITRTNTKTRPRDTVTKVEALALLWKWLNWSIDTNHQENTLFYDTKGKSAEKWQENLLQSARKSGIILTNEKAVSDKYLWKHNDSITRKEVFALLETLRTMDTAIKQTLYLNFSGEAQFVPKKIHIISDDPKKISDIKAKKYDEVIQALSPVPHDFRTEWETIFVIQHAPDFWWQVYYSSITTLFGKVYQIFSSYNPYEKAMSAMLKEFNLASEKEFYALPYGEKWEKTRDFIENFYIQELQKTPLVLPSSNT